MTKAQEYAALQAQRQAITKQIRAVAKEAFKEQAKAIFDANPTLVAFSWRQYTPYFNDGEPCTFSANTEEPDLQVGDETELGDWYFYGSKKEPATARDLVGLQVRRFLGTYDDTDLLEMFDDHARVVVTRDGVDVQSYDHD